VWDFIAPPLAYAKQVSTNAMNINAQMAKCCLAYAKQVPTSAMNIDAQMAECRLAYAKV